MFIYFFREGAGGKFISNGLRGMGPNYFLRTQNYLNKGDSYSGMGGKIFPGNQNRGWGGGMWAKNTCK